jgi:hypothetical protein
MTNSPVVDAPSNSASAVPRQKEPQIFLSVKFVSLAEGALQKSSASWVSAGNQASVLSPEQFQGFNGLTEQDDSIRTIGSPKVLTLNGREARVSIGSEVPFAGTNSAVPFGITNVNIGSYVSVLPYYYSSSATFHLKISVQFNQLVGDPSQPIFESLQSTNEADLFPDQTLVMATKIKSAGIPDNASNLPTRPGDLLVFITPTLIDEVGNRIEAKPAW